MTDLAEKEKNAIKYLQMFAPKNGDPYYLCYSGGKDSDVILRLAMETLNPSEFEVLHSITTVDSPVTNRYVNEIFKELQEKVIKCSKSIPKGEDGQPTNMWKLIVEKQMPPTRLVRYCCQTLKETHTPNRIAVLGRFDSNPVFCCK